MRTFKLTYNLRVNSDANISVSTEEIVANDDEVSQCGLETMKAIQDFILGMGKEFPLEESQ